jgi:lysophospholipase
MKNMEFAEAIPEESLAQAYPEKVLPYLNDAGHAGSFEGKSGITLRYFTIEKNEERAALVVLGGYNESYIKYAEFFYELRDLPVSIYALDHRGQGFSDRLLPDREKGYVAKWEDYTADLKLFMDQVVKAEQHAKVFVLGHSLGGGIAAAYLEKYPGDFDGAILNAPLVRTTLGFFGTVAMNVIDLLGGGEGYVPGGAPFTATPFEKNRETHSPARHERKLRDYDDHREIRLGYATVHLAAEAGRMTRFVQSGAGSIAVPVLVLRADKDVWVDQAGSDEFCRKLPKCRRVFLKGAWHEILIERDDIRDKALAEIRSFLKEQSR